MRLTSSLTFELDMSPLKLKSGRELWASVCRSPTPRARKLDKDYLLHDLGNLTSAIASTILNFALTTRPLPLEVHLQSCKVPNFPSLEIQIAKPAYLTLVQYAQSRPDIVFALSRKQRKITANDILTYCLAKRQRKRDSLNFQDAELGIHPKHVGIPNSVETLKYGTGSTTKP
jgi:pre-mRNA-splicing helicase BRR2